MCGTFTGVSRVSPRRSHKFHGGGGKFSQGFAVRHGARFAVVQGHLRGPITGSFKSPCRTFYRSSIETVALSCLVFEKTAYTVGKLSASDRKGGG